MKINRKLNLVIPVEVSAGKVYVHSTPIARETFEQHFKVIGRTLSAIYEQGLGRIAGPRVAALLLREQAEELGGPTDEGRADARRSVDATLFNEIYRLTNVVVQGDRGWETIPYGEAIKGVLTKDDAAEVDNALAFFTVISSMMRGPDLEAAQEGSKLWGGSITSLNCTEYANSLPISIKGGSSGEKSPTSSLRLSTG